MRTDNIWQQAADLTNRVLQVTSGLDLPRGNLWYAVVTVFLTQANERLDSIRVLLDKNYRDSATILTRSLFELVVTLNYIAKDAKDRLPEYLKHGGIPLTNEDAQQLQRKLAKEQLPDMKDIVPRQSWKTLKDMCRDLGSPWPEEYKTFYRFASVPTHAGSFTLTLNYVELLKQEPPSDHYKVIVLLSALSFYLRVPNVAAQVFPEQIKLATVTEMASECEKVGQSLSEQLRQSLAKR